MEEAAFTDFTQGCVSMVLAHFNFLDGSVRPIKDQNFKAQATESVSQHNDEGLRPNEIGRLRAQIAAYKMLSRNDPLPRVLLNQVSGRRMDDHFPLAYEYPLDVGGGEQLPYDLSKALYSSQMRNTSRLSSFSVPGGIDPQALLTERENRY